MRQMSVRVVLVADSRLRVAWYDDRGMRVRAFPVSLPSDVKYWTVLDDDLAVVGEPDAFLRHVRFGRDQSESTTRAYAGSIALFLRWCARTGRHWHDGVGQFGLFITWLRHAGPQVSGLETEPGAEVLTGPGQSPVRSERRSDVHLLPDSSALGCAVTGAHLHVVRRDNPNGAWAKSRRQRAVPADFLVVQAFDAYEFERMAVPEAAVSDFVLVNLARDPVGAPIRPDAVNALIAAAGRRAGLARPISPHQLRHAFGSNVEGRGVASDATFRSSREHALPAAQRAALRCPRPAGRAARLR